MSDEMTPISLDALELLEYEPNRYPFLFLDRITECVPGKYVKGYKNFTNNEWFFPKHYVGHPIVPGAVQTEALSQIITIAITTLPEVEDVNVEGIKWNISFHKEIKPGDRLDMEAELLSFKRGIGKGVARGYVDGELACELEASIVVPCIFEKFKPQSRK